MHTHDYPGPTHRGCGTRHRIGTPCPPRGLTRAQRDGLACVECGSTEGAMRPVGHVDGCQVFAHPACAPAPPDHVGSIVVASLPA